MPGASGWVELTAAGPRGSMDRVVECLLDAGSPGVEEVSENKDLPEEPVLVSTWGDEDLRPLTPSEKKERATVRAYLPEEGKGSITALRRALKKLGWTVKASPFKDRDWQTAWKKGVRPVHLAGFLVKPTWSRAVPKPGEKTIEIDPGVAFGTGSHETTRMCLRALSDLARGRVSPKEAVLLDVGTGTGVLAIAASRLGFKRVTANDLDPMALKAARRNISANRARVRVSKKSVEDIRGRFDVVMANILSGELTRLAGTLTEKTRPGGYLVLSGILGVEAPRLAETYSNLGMESVKTYSRGEWRCLVFARAGGKP